MSTDPSRRALPRGACNAHVHVFGPRERFPYAAGAPFVPDADAPKEALFALNDRLGLERCVVVQSTCHGQDNRAAEDAVAARPDSYRAVALLPTDVVASTLPASVACASTSWAISAARHRWPTCWRWPAASSRSAGICRSMATHAC